MNIHEYQGSQLLSQFGVTVPKGEPCSTAQEARDAASKLLAEGSTGVVLKSQIHAGGRGKGTFTSGLQGGVKRCRTVDEVEKTAAAMLGQLLVTKQTGPEGRMVRKLFVVEAIQVKQEFYLAVALDRASGLPVIMASTEGGMDIEEVAVRTPSKIFREPIDPTLGLMPYQGRKLAVALGLRGEHLAAASRLIAGVWRTWWECDASLVEINPLALITGPDGNETLAAIDAKINFDDNALARHPEIKAMRDLHEESPLEVEASKFNLNYIKLDGNIACLVNGAGLAMATMDIIQHYGGRPANFLDVGGGASTEQVTAAFGIILQDPHVCGILVNIFGGIMDCNVIATGIVAAAHSSRLQIPLVVRLEGNNADLAKRTLSMSKLAIQSAESMADAAQKVVKAVSNGASVQR